MDGKNLFPFPMSRPFQNRLEIACRICNQVFKNNQDLINHATCHYFMGHQQSHHLSNFLYPPQPFPLNFPANQRPAQQRKPKSAPLFKPHTTLVMLQQVALAQRAAAKRSRGSPSLDESSPSLELPYPESGVPAFSGGKDSSRAPFPPIPILEHAKRRRLTMDRRQPPTVSFLDKLEGHPDIIVVNDSDSEKDDKGANAKELDLTLRI